MRAFVRRQGWGTLVSLFFIPTDNYLLVLEYFIDHRFAAFVYSYYFLNGGVAGHGDIDEVVAGVELGVDGRTLFQHVFVDGDLRAFGLGFDGDAAHARG